MFFKIYIILIELFHQLPDIYFSPTTPPNVTIAVLVLTELPYSLQLTIMVIIYHFRVWTWWPPFHRRHIQMRCREKKSIFVSPNQRDHIRPIQYQDAVLPVWSIIKMRSSRNRIIFVIPTLLRRHLYIKWAPDINVIFVSLVWLLCAYLTVCLNQRGHEFPP